MARHLVFIIGTRAQLIKVAPVMVACEQRSLPCTLLMTGQHHETMQDLLEEFGVTSPRVSAVTSSEHATVRSLLRWLPAAYRGVGARLRELAGADGNLDVLVHGDTLSTVIGAVAGWRRGARVVHLESGLTSGKLLDPFPEELSRRIVFRMTRVAMCPSLEAAEYMRLHCPRAKVIDTGGNTILDAVTIVGDRDMRRTEDAPYLVVSLHRFQNVYDRKRLHSLIDLLEGVSEKYPLHFVLHPTTRKRLAKEALLGRLESLPGVHLSPRLGYGAFLRLAAGAACVLTDGGSNQEELAALGVPTIVMRKATERGDGLGANVIMEAEVPGNLVDYLRAGGFRELERAHAVRPGASPSERIADFLAWEPRDISQVA